MGKPSVASPSTRIASKRRKPAQLSASRTEDRADCDLLHQALSEWLPTVAPGG